jgi:hypothetical protein
VRRSESVLLLHKVLKEHLVENLDLHLLNLDHSDADQRDL